MINEWLLPQIQRKDVSDIVWLQQDGASPHFAMSVKMRVNELFADRWIRRGSEKPPSSLTWPVRSPDVTTPDNSLW
ncbi:hypothetical protein ANN_04443 [Periplaneta americana]|uniref:Uncharacterized protein n=1 Tax=Periplaneta americana TaxID=6978 RepID=A0ABQ8TAH8_PERAM|nr:hypothetical protein ANN_04443 [Periplaneta americana]